MPERIYNGDCAAANAGFICLLKQSRVLLQRRPKQLCSDWGTRFTAEIFQQALKEHNIEHIKASVKHPQTNGKLERWWQTLVQTTEHFGDLQYAVWFYNNKRPHMSLNKKDSIVTPIEAFQAKKHKKQRNQHESQKET